MKNLFYCFFLVCFCVSIFTCKQDGDGAWEMNKKITKLKSGNKIDRFETAILNMEKEDSLRTILENEIIFVGSSSIRMWNSLLTDMLPLRTINRGFGGSTIPEVLYFMDRIVLPNKPPVVVFYCGENDINDGYSPKEVFENFQLFDTFLHQKLPKTQVVYISMKPSLARWSQWGKFEEGNKLIKNYIDTQSRLHYFDSGESMLTTEGTPDSTIFIEDGLHMNASGYERWTKGLKPTLLSLMGVSEEVPANQ